ncbi:MAG TPA: hypothetical protein VEB59_16605 [Gemmatimonadales bacterium]|nr:hypothetical protein [Gemmatimonadales bacterium]
MRVVLLLILAALAAAPAGAQTPAAGSREYQLNILEHQRKTLLAMADSMPEEFYRDKATPEQRDFAQQIHHAAQAVVYLMSLTTDAGKPTLPDTAKALNSRAGLREYVNGAFDHAAAELKKQTPATRNETVKLFGQSMPRWQVWDEIHTHTVWTAGQVVANFRKHGMAPPAFSFF